MACFIVMAIGACAGAVMFQSWRGTLGMAACGLGCAIAAFILMRPPTAKEIADRSLGE
jgi:hypothetical protein